MTSSQTIVLIIGETLPSATKPPHHYFLNPYFSPLGATQSIGYETAKSLLLSSPTYHVLLGSRDPTKSSDAVSALQSFPNLKGTVAPI